MFLCPLDISFDEKTSLSFSYGVQKKTIIFIVYVCNVCYLFLNLYIDIEKIFVSYRYCNLVSNITYFPLFL